MFVGAIIFRFRSCIAAERAGDTFQRAYDLVCAYMDRLRIRPVSGWGYAEMPLEQMIEMAAVVIARGKGDVPDGKPGIS